MTEMASESAQTRRVGIIGAGVAGLRAADILIQRGYRVVLFEARGRLGGRIAQASQAGNLIDLGPNWLQRAEDDVILSLAQETRTGIHLWPETPMVFGDGDDPLPETDVTEIQETFWEIFGRACRIGKDHEEYVSSNDSLMDFVREAAGHAFTEQSAREASRKRGLLLQMAEMWGTFVGTPIEAQSLKYCWLEESVDGEESFVAGTFSSILSRIAAPVTEGATLRYHSIVRHIANQDDSTVQVMIDDLPTEVFDEVIVTVPLGCLKLEEPSFSPPLPSPLQQAINSIGYGCLDKVYMTFPSAFWQTSKGDSRTLPGITYWLAPNHTRAPNTTEWLQTCINLASLPPPYAHPTLLFYVYGPCSRYIAELAASTPLDKFNHQLFDLFHGCISRLPNYVSDSPECQPTRVLATAWANDKHAGYGSYSNFPTGLENGDQHIECMRRGLPERHIWFAGEHTAPFSALGTVTGAYLAGERIATRIIENNHPFPE